jgi:hypothetical protein
MGIGIVLIFWLFAGSLAAGVGALILAGGMAVFTRKGQAGRGRAIRLSAALPFIGLCWWAAVFVFQATINGVVFHRDPGLGDSWETPLPNGYMLIMIDVTERGWVSRKTEGEMGPPVSQLQVADRYILGRYEDAGLSRLYFLLDTATDKLRDFPDLEALRMAAEPLGIQPALEPINDVYSRYRTGWFDYFTLLLFLCYPIGALIFWAKRVRDVRTGTILAAA